MTRNELAKMVYLAHGGMTFAQAREVVDGAIELMTEGICKDGRLLVSGFGTFKVVDRKARKGRDLGKGNTIEIPGYKTVVFIPSRKWFSEKEK